jgi:hypothetical protein
VDVINYSSQIEELTQKYKQQTNFWTFCYNDSLVLFCFWMQIVCNSVAFSQVVGLLDANYLQFSSVFRWLVYRSFNTNY